MRTAMLAAAVLSLAGTDALAAASSAHFHVGAQVMSSAHLVARSTSTGIGLDSRAFGGEARGLLVEQRSGPSVSVHGSAGSVLVPREGSAPLLVRSAGELTFESAGP